MLVDGSIARLDAAARLILRDSELARDAVQEAMVRAWRDLPGLRDPDKFDAWLRRLTVHACIDAARHRRRRTIEVTLTPSDDPPVADAYARIADRDLLDRAMGRLDPGQRAIIVLRFYLDLTLPEAAAALGIPLGTAKARLHRSLAAMRIAVGPVDGATPVPATAGGIQ